MSELHVLNGDLALALWKKCDFPARELVWKETYLEGPLPLTEDLHLFRCARAGHLAAFTELAGIDVSALYTHLQKMDETLLQLSGNDRLMLWFDACIFDQTILMRILCLLHQKQTEIPEILLYCCDSNHLTMEDFQRGKTEKIRLTAYDLEIASQAWNAFAGEDAEKMIFLAQQENFANLPAMQKALLRCAEEVPDKNGLSRTQRQILQIVANKSCSFEEIFKMQSVFEEFPFLGDTACQRLLDDLVSRELLKISPDGSYQTGEVYHG